MRVKKVSIASLSPDQANARTHNKRNIQTIALSLKRFGQQKPIVVDGKGVIRAGNGTVEAARSLGWKEISVVVTDLESAEAVAYAIADNRTAELAEWDDETLATILASLDSDAQPATGFTEAEIERLIRGLDDDDDEPPDPKIDKADELQEKWKVGRGDLWLIGDHRLLCGDATSEEGVAKAMDGSHAAMAFTDPPWNVAIGKDSNPRHRQREGLENDDLSDAEYGEFLASFAARMAEVVRGDVYCVLGASEWPRLDLMLRGAGFHWSATIIWAKDAFVLGRSKYHRRYEPIWYGWHKQGKSSYQGGRSKDDVWEFDRPKRSPEHPTMKPPVLVAEAIANSSGSGDVVYDPFLGSGTTMVAAEQLQRRCYGMEIEPKYCAVVLERMVDMGLEPVRESDG